MKLHLKNEKIATFVVVLVTTFKSIWIIFTIMIYHLSKRDVLFAVSFLRILKSMSIMHTMDPSRKDKKFAVDQMSKNKNLISLDVKTAINVIFVTEISKTKAKMSNLEVFSNAALVTRTILRFRTLKSTYDLFMKGQRRPTNVKPVTKTMQMLIGVVSDVT